MTLLRAILRPAPAPTLAERIAALAPHPPREGGRRLRERTTPTISVVTVCFRSAKTIADTIASVREQTCIASGVEVEHVVVDGGSDDGTVAVLEAHDATLGYWRSEPDGGIYDAFNKGIALARGEFVQILNSDDWMEPDQLERALACVRTSGADFAHGDIVLHGWRGGDVRIGGDPHWDLRVRRTMPAIHQATVLARRSVFERVGLFRTDLRIASDYDWFIRLAKAGIRGAHDPTILAHMRAGGASTARQRRTIAEGFACAYGNGDRLLPCAAHWAKRWVWPNGAPRWLEGGIEGWADGWATRIGRAGGEARGRLRGSAIAVANAVPALRRVPGRALVKRAIGLREPAPAAAAPDRARLDAFIEVRDLDGGLDAGAIERLLLEASALGAVALPERPSPAVAQAARALALGGATLVTADDPRIADCRAVLREEDDALRSGADFPILLLVGPRGLRIERGVAVR